jgi:Golgi SNAP receptor complex protein 1
MQRASSPSLQPLLDEEADLSVGSSPQSWDQLRKEARQLENEIELKLASLSKSGQAPATMNSSGQELEAEELLKKV